MASAGSATARPRPKKSSASRATGRRDHGEFPFRGRRRTGRHPARHAGGRFGALGARQLRAQGLTALELREAAARRGQIELFGPRLSDSDLAWATRQLASLLAAGLPLEAALTATVEQAEKKHITDTFTAVRRCAQRPALSDTLSARPRDFPPIYRALIKAGEDSGDLARIMERLADYIENATRCAPRC